VVGVDLDNTIICYDDLFHRLALESELVASAIQPSKKLVRDHIRGLPEGDVAWQRLQAEAYGPRIHEAGLFPGVKECFAAFRSRGIRSYIVSHKTRFAGVGDRDVSLRDCALDFLRASGIVDCLEGGETDVYFSDTRREKCRTVETLRCEAFVDDLVETFQEPDFPVETERLLFDPQGVYAPDVPARRFCSWAAIQEHVCG